MKETVEQIRARHSHMNKSELFEPIQAERIGTLLDEIDRISVQHDKMVERSVGAMAIAENNDGHELIPRDCPMLVAVATLAAENERLREALDSAIDLFDTSQSGYIPGCREDKRFIRERDSWLQEARALASQSQEKQT